MGNLFGTSKSKSKDGKKGAGTVTEKDRAMLELKNARDRLKRHRKKLESESSKLQDQAKALIAKKQKERALLVLKLKRFRETEANNVDAQLFSVLEMIQNVEWESQNLQVMKALKAGTKALNDIHEEMSVDDVANLLDETNEALEVENQINQLLAGQLDLGNDEQLEKELAELMGDPVPAAKTKSAHSSAAISKDTVDLDSLPSVPSLPVLPTAPTGKLASASSEASNAEIMKDNPILS